MTTAPLNYKEILQAGQDLFRGHAYEAVIQTLGQIGDDDPMIYAQALAWIGRAHCRSDAFEQGLEALARSLRIRTAPLTQYYMGEALFRMGNHDGALEFLDLAVLGDDKLTDAYILIGTIRRMLGRSDEAIKALDMALRNDPKALAARYQLAQCAYDVGDLQRATSQAYLIVQQKEDYGPIHLLLGHCTLKLCDYRQAAYEYYRALTLLEPSIEIYEGLGRAFANLKDLEQSLRAFEGVLILDPDHEVATVAAARIAERLKNVEVATMLWTSAARFGKYYKLAAQALDKLGAEVPEPPADAEPTPEAAEGEAPKKRGRAKAKKPTAAANLGSLKNKELPRVFDPPVMIDRSSLIQRTPSSSSATAPLTTHAAGTLELSSRQAPAEKPRTRPMTAPLIMPAIEPARVNHSFDNVIRPYTDIFEAFMAKLARPARPKDGKDTPAKAPKPKREAPPPDETIAEVLKKRRHDHDEEAEE